MSQNTGRSRQKFISIREVAAELGISERSVWRLIEDGELPTHKFGASTRIRRDDLDVYIERSRRRRTTQADEADGDGDGELPTHDEK